MSARTLDTMKPYHGVDTPAWPLLEKADQAAARYLLHGAGLPDFGDYEAGLILLAAIPPLCESQVAHTRWYDGLKALQAKYSLTFEEFDAIESHANGEACTARFEGYLFGLAVGLRLADSRQGGGE